MLKILIAEDDRDICEILKIYLSSEGYDVTITNDGKEALTIFSAHTFDLAIFDIMMPEIDGYQLTKEIREISEVPILILSAKDADHDKILGLKIGADDYITKPFNPMELVARVNAHLRRRKKSNNLNTFNERRYENIHVNVDTCRVFVGGVEKHLTATEYKILNLFLLHPKAVFSKGQIAKNINVDYFEGSDHTIVVHIANLREKLGLKADGTQFIKTKKGLGYKLD